VPSADPAWRSPPGAARLLADHHCRSPNPNCQFYAQHRSRAKEPPSVPIGGTARISPGGSGHTP
jgi:hypothetical protein